MIHLPPTRIQRYCCQYLKEENGTGRKVVTGVRWAESTNRAANQGLVTIYKGKNAPDEIKGSGSFKKTPRGGYIMADDNAESRRLVEVCSLKCKTTINPIIDWTDSDVWEFIHEYDVPYCELYDKGFKRLGCIGCPMSGGKTQIEEFERYPRFKALYLKAFDQMLERRKAAGKAGNWQCAEDVYEWWIRDKKNEQVPLMDELEDKDEAITAWNRRAKDE